MSKPIIVAGIGNTTLRLAIPLSLEEWPVSWATVQELRTEACDLDRLGAWLPRAPVDWHVASVHRPCESQLASWVRQRRPADGYCLCSHKRVPIGVNVAAPERVGADRLAAAVAANRLRSSNRAGIVVDAGTAINVDVVDAAGVFQGGAILPGFSMSARALAAGTDLLPEIHKQLPDAAPNAIGKDTESAMRSGLFYGCRGGLLELTHRIRAELPTDAQLFLTGGDARHCADLFGPDSEFVADLVLQGIVASALHIRQGI